MRKSILLLVMIISGVVIFSAGRSERLEREPIKLILWGGVPYDDGPKQVETAFNREFKDQGIEVEYHRYVNNGAGNLKLDVNILAGSDIDLFFSYEYEQYSHRSKNMALKLDGLIERDGFIVEDYIGEIGNEKSIVYDSYYGLASKVYNNGFLANKDMFDAAGIDIPTKWTWAEFLETVEKLTVGSGDNKVYGAYFETLTLQHAPFIILEAELGADFYFTDDGERIDLSNPRYIEIINNIKLLMDRGYIPDQASVINQKIATTPFFTNGKCAMFLGSWLIRDIKNKEKYPHDFVTAFIPFPSDRDNIYYSVGGPGDMLQINKNSKFPDEAWTFIKWYLKEGIYEMSRFGRVPLIPELDINYVTNLLMDDSEDLFHKESIINGYFKPADHYSIPYHSSTVVLNILREELDRFYLGEITAEEALSRAEERSNKIIGSPD